MQNHHLIVDMLLNIFIRILAFNLIEFKFKSKPQQEIKFSVLILVFQAQGSFQTLTLNKHISLNIGQIQQKKISNSSSLNYLQLSFFHLFQTKSFSGSNKPRNITLLKLDSFRCNAPIRTPPTAAPEPGR